MNNYLSTLRSFFKVGIMTISLLLITGCVVYREPPVYPRPYYEPYYYRPYYWHPHCFNFYECNQFHCYYGRYCE